MKLIGVMLRAIGSTLEGEFRKLGATADSPPSQSDSVAPEESSAKDSGSTVKSQPRLTVVDAVFENGKASSSHSEEPPRTEESDRIPPGVQTSEHERPQSPEPASPPAEEVTPEELEAVVKLLARSKKPLKGFEIAEGTGISPWWRLKDVLSQLSRDGRVSQSADGQFTLGATPPGEA